MGVLPQAMVNGKPITHYPLPITYLILFLLSFVALFDYLLPLER